MKKIYINGDEMTISVYPTVEDGIAAEMAAGELSAAFLVDGELWSLDRCTPYGATARTEQGHAYFGDGICGTTVGYSLQPTAERELI